MKSCPKVMIIKLLILTSLLAGSILVAGCKKKAATPDPTTIPDQPAATAVIGGAAVVETTQQPTLATQSVASPAGQSPMPSLTPTSTALAPCWLIVTQDLAILRSGPGRTYSIVGTGTKGERLQLLGRNKAGDWLYILFEQDLNAWLPTILGKVTCDINSLPEIPELSLPVRSPTPTATKPTVKPYGSGLAVPPALDGAAPVPATSTRLELAIYISLIGIGALLLTNTRVILTKMKLSVKQSIKTMLQLIASIF